MTLSLRRKRPTTLPNIVREATSNSPIAAARKRARLLATAGAILASFVGAGLDTPSAALADGWQARGSSAVKSADSGVQLTSGATPLRRMPGDDAGSAPVGNSLDTGSPLKWRSTKSAGISSGEAPSTTSDTRSVSNDSRNNVPSSAPRAEQRRDFGGSKRVAPAQFQNTAQPDPFERGGAAAPSDPFEKGSEGALSEPEPLGNERDAGSTPFEREDELAPIPRNGDVTESDGESDRGGDRGELFPPDDRAAPDSRSLDLPKPNGSDKRDDERNARGRTMTEQDCAEGLAALRAKTLADIDLNIRVVGKSGSDYPFECFFGPQPLMPRSWECTEFQWKASALCHKPLYYEDVQLERYGHEWPCPLQPVVSAAHFFVGLPLLPYKMGLQTPNECVYALGYYRPGNCAPYMIEPEGVTWRAVAFEAAVVGGTVAIFP